MTWQGGVHLNELFGLSPEEEVMESFQVELRQTYACTHNALSKPQEVRRSSSCKRLASTRSAATCLLICPAATCSLLT